MKTLNDTAVEKLAATSGGDADAVSEATLLSINSPIFKDVHVQLEAKLGQARMSVQELLALKSGAVVKLDLKMNEPIELRLNESLIARGEIVAVDDNFGVRIIEIAQLP